MKNILFSLLFLSTCLCFLSAQIISFQNEIVYQNKQLGVYKFELNITHGLSMSKWDDRRKTYDPVIYNPSDKSFKARNYSYSDSCSAVTAVNTNDIPSIVTAAGRHRNMLLINKIFPGTPIVVPVNSAVEITVRNQMVSEVLSIHWHGQTQKDTFFMDGVSRITQCPINPGDSYVYKFVASDIGTHWYHAHSGVQRTEGLYGPFIVTKSVIKGNTYEKEFYFILQDWIHEDSNSVFMHVNWENSKFYPGYNNTKLCFTPKRMDDGTVIAPLPMGDSDAILINGKGWYSLPASPKSIVSSIFNLPIETFNIKPNKKYLFRVIGANAGHPLEIRVGGHKITVVASDGNPIKPIENVDSLIVNSGERYDFEIQAKDASDNMNYLIVVRTLETKNFDYTKFSNSLYGIAILKYDSVAETKISCSTACNDVSKLFVKVNCPFWPIDSYDYKCIGVGSFNSLSIPANDQNLIYNNYGLDEFQEIFLNFHFAGSVAQRSSVNGKQFVLPSQPPYFYKKSSKTIVECPKDCNERESSCHCTHIVELKKNKVIQLVLYNMGKGAGIEGTAHPVHIHGHHAYIVKMGYPYYSTDGKFVKNNPDINCGSDDSYCNNAGWNNPAWNNGNIGPIPSPVRKDTVFVPVGGYVVLRFRANNIGYWFLHCHIEVHQAEGMSVILKEGSDDDIRQKTDFSRINTCGYGPDLPVSPTIVPITTLSTKLQEINAASGLKLTFTLLFVLKFAQFNFQEL
jgi:FtsP/CotA-like multicopper oxidase with cupredoxin domain